MIDHPCILTKEIMKNILIFTTILSLGSVITLKSMPVVANPSHQQYQVSKDVKTIQSVPIPANELPPPLDKNGVFREITSGGIAGKTYETVLLKDGQLIRTKTGDANDSERSIKKVTGEQVKQFEKLLTQDKFEQFNKLSFPAPPGSADYITYTITSQKATTQYNDISQSQIPNKLDKVVKAWNELKNSAK